MSSPTFIMPLMLSLFLLSLIASIAQAQVPADRTFKLVNEGDDGVNTVEYWACYRMLFQLYARSAVFDEFGYCHALGLGGQPGKSGWLKCHLLVGDRL
ncbi:hypothetical protein RchiOBHm_Chr5g0031091 [Rosa chinensis]|uniref:Uncharacterized protein n=1 Tax=Rosa chinensis TaxID=74649 RepID=A0A2P6QA29_ROSCH|nr:hypothetical protein RchiOBHm_Chr5g0031091 [Rosa chinensis]